jgi:DNA-binding MltR family transcriptional regulator
LEVGVLEGAFEVIMLGFVKTIHVQLPDKAIHFVMTEIFRQDDLFEFDYVLDCELASTRRPIDDLEEIWLLI